ncbi:MAG: (2Fe-2S)-binding protein [Bacteroidetes bacterium 4572_117]|nr:MAG: (2Fe-2S)-binding protein [Bacteroidetes bacterium 4572_117]
MIEFILNNKLIRTNEPSGAILLDFIRKNEKLYGTKIGCREGDCGACTVLVGSLNGNKVLYQSVVSCLSPLGNIAGKHVVTIEGINNGALSPIQSAFIKNNATQCGFCTPGFIVSLTGFSLSGKKAESAALRSVAGNICRCTGYKSIERAVSIIVEKLRQKSPINSLQWLIKHNYIPSYFSTIPNRLKNLNAVAQASDNETIIGGGTDIYVQKADEVSESKLGFIKNQNQDPQIFIDNGKCIIDTACSVTDLMQSKVLHDIIPGLRKHLTLVSSEQIRNMATVAGNFVNASPIGDLSIIFLALNAELIISNKGNKRNVLLKNFFKGYKQIDLGKNEIIERIQFSIPAKGFKYNFEKVSKRTHLDIASVNTAICISLEDEIINDVMISAGGISAIPLLLHKSADFLKGKELSVETIKKASEIINSEISPISDIRGSSKYKQLLLRQLFYQHFIELFPKLFDIKKLTTHA